ncbi:MAG: hypothetical protein HFACDABA_01238 [Anaerolineales bacterium]|nr:hypothetical protein [Anaerolineales bacterium]
MPRDIKYLFIGLVMGGALFFLLVAIFFLAAPGDIPAELRPALLDTPTFTARPVFIASQEIPSATPTLRVESTATFTQPPTPVPFTPTETSSPTVTATLSPGAILLLRGDLVIRGPRTEAELIRLYETSLAFTAGTFSDARRLGERINGKGYGSPTLICGPLSISILSEAGLVRGGLVPYNFWLLNPDDAPGRAALATAFPSAQYGNMRIRTRIDQINWNASPLLPGDFVYIYAGNGGNFEHMLVVNRVDSAGRAYSVTNYNAGDGFVILEVMLYDPSDPNIGMFHEWTKKQWQATGSTGYDGLEVWRLIATP